MLPSMNLNRRDESKCIRCGICTSIYPQKALTPEPVPKYRRPPAHYFSLGMKLAPGITRHLLTG